MLLLFALAGCERTPETAVGRETFVEVNVALRRIDPELPNAEQARADTLAAYGVTEDELFAFVAAYEDELEELAEIWQEIRDRLEEDEEAEPPEQNKV